MTMQLPSFAAPFQWPEQEQCPSCRCCFAELCRRGAARTGQCRGCVRPEYQAAVFGCPCSSPLTRGTAAWRAERVRATERATECPLHPSVEVVLRALVRGEVVNDYQTLALLRVAGFVGEMADELFTVTELGQVYLHARSDVRFPASAEVVVVDRAARLAHVIVGAWDGSRTVPVLLEHLTRATGLEASELLGVWLDVDANCHATDPDDLVLTRIRVAEPLPAWFMAPGPEALAQRAADVATVGGERA